MVPSISNKPSFLPIYQSFGVYQPAFNNFISALKINEFKLSRKLEVFILSEGVDKYLDQARIELQENRSNKAAKYAKEGKVPTKEEMTTTYEEYYNLLTKNICAIPKLIKEKFNFFNYPSTIFTTFDSEIETLFGKMGKYYHEIDQKAAIACFAKYQDLGYEPFYKGPYKPEDTALAFKAACDISWEMTHKLCEENPGEVAKNLEERYNFYYNVYKVKMPNVAIKPFKVEYPKISHSEIDCSGLAIGTFHKPACDSSWSPQK